MGRPPGPAAVVEQAGGALIAAVLVIAASFGAVGCGDERPRDDDIVATRDGLLEAIGISLDEVEEGAYGRDVFEDTTACPDLDEDDRWAASRGFLGPGELRTQGEVFEGATGYLEDEGFDVERLQDAGRDGTLGIRAVKDDLVVLVDVSTNGGTEVNLLAGPCAPEVGRFRDGRFEPLEGG